jgi:hypothetical protein
MKTLMLALAVLLSFTSQAQKMKSGVAPFDRKDLNMISVTFKGDFNPFIDRIKSDLGPGQKYNDNQDGYPGIRWFGIQKQEWGPNKLTLQVYWIIGDDKQIVLISCLAQNGDDMLIPETELTLKIKKYLKQKLN